MINEIKSVRALWSAVLMRAILDLEVVSKRARPGIGEVTCASQAASWIMSRRNKKLPDFEYVCGVIELNPGRLRDHIRPLREKLNYHLRRINIY
jgi:hypothetical protein